MKGQWIGKAKGDYEGLMIVNVDDLGTCYEGAAFLIPDNQKLPASVGFFKTNNKKNKNKVIAFTLPIDPRNSLPNSWEKIQDLYPGMNHSKDATINYYFKLNELHLTVKTDLGTQIQTDIFKKPIL